ncbi:hypothetical protein BCR35DRAFT_347403 [Leucosporidium creatinivorum]|uniref:Uncharacterized protein n=1 Tax=Leucosporidium creatinivorum TaxID=106004 RepID=A0A1Y2G1V2_9BASI|nr:hypothetical protein BCR35DRAFT_347403 [Leucosporidium creatinivorum]
MDREVLTFFLLLIIQFPLTVTQESQVFTRAALAQELQGCVLIHQLAVSSLASVVGSQVSVEIDLKRTSLHILFSYTRTTRRQSCTGNDDHPLRRSRVHLSLQAPTGLSHIEKNCVKIYFHTISQPSTTSGTSHSSHPRSRPGSVVHHLR